MEPLIGQVRSGNAHGKRGRGAGIIGATYRRYKDGGSRRGSDASPGGINAQFVSDHHRRLGSTRALEEDEAGNLAGSNVAAVEGRDGGTRRRGRAESVWRRINPQS